MEGNKRVDELMLPVLNAINRHVKDRDAKTDIYNRAYEAVIISMEVKEAENAELREQLRWIPVSERLPDTYKPVLISYTTLGKPATPKVKIYMEQNKQWCDVDLGGWISCDYVTHWLPIPPVNDNRQSASITVNKGGEVTVSNRCPECGSIHEDDVWVCDLKGTDCLDEWHEQKPEEE